MIKVQQVSLDKKTISCYCKESKINPVAMSKYFFVLLLVLLSACRFDPQNYEMVNRQPNIFPDYTNVVVPPNIAPLNFYINDTADHYRIKISSVKGKAIELSQSSPSVIIPIGKWHKLLRANKGNVLLVEVYAKKGGQWYKYLPIRDSIVDEPIDSYLAYRLINHVNILWREMGIYQRNLENFDETPIFRNRSNNNGCVNCHNFNRSNPAQMTLHFRKENPGTVLLVDGVKKKLDTKTPYTMSAFSYPAWHPGGKQLAYVVNKVTQIFTSTIDYHEVVFDGASDLVVYDIEKNMVTTCPQVSSKNRENMPAFSPDGRWLYYISAPPALNDSMKMYVKFSLVRISYDAATHSWGQVDTVISAAQTGKSITFPRVSPDGRYIMFTMCRYSYFSIFDQTSDLYLYDTLTQKFEPLPVNTPYTESYHTWSKSGRWFVFTSRSLDNCYSRPFFSYFDKNGKAHKAFVLPQKDPLFYKYFMKNYNIPELITGRVAVTENEMRDFVRTKPTKVQFDSLVDIDALSGATYIYRNMH